MWAVVFFMHCVSLLLSVGVSPLVLLSYKELPPGEEFGYEPPLYFEDYYGDWGEPFPPLPVSPHSIPWETWNTVTHTLSLLLTASQSKG